MKKQKKIDNPSGTGNIGVPSLGVAGMTGQVHIMSSSDDCPKTALGSDPRSAMQNVTGMNTTRHIKMIMEDVNRYNKVTDTGGVGTPRSGVEGLVEQDPSTSLSGDCERGRYASQDGRPIEETRKTMQKTHGETREQETYTFMSANEGDNSDASEWLPFPTTKNISGKKRDRQSSSEENETKNPRKRTTGETVQE